MDWFIHRFRVRCEEQGFDGNPVNISYTYDGSGLVPGHVNTENLPLCAMAESMRWHLLPLLKSRL